MSVKQETKTVNRYTRFVSETTPRRRKRKLSYAEKVALAEFGPRYLGWREWADFRDLTPKQIERLRAGAFA